MLLYLFISKQYLIMKNINIYQIISIVICALVTQFLQGSYISDKLGRDVNARLYNPLNNNLDYNYD